KWVSLPYNLIMVRKFLKCWVSIRRSWINISVEQYPVSADWIWTISRGRPWRNITEVSKTAVLYATYFPKEVSINGKDAVRVTSGTHRPSTCSSRLVGQTILKALKNIRH